MRHYAAIVAVGEDRPGLVDGLSRYVLDCGGNIEDSRMAILGGEFAVLMLVVGEADALEKLQNRAADAAQKTGLAIQVKRTKAPGDAARKGTIPYGIAAYSMDHPGIVHRIAAFLAERSINIRALDTHLSHAPITGLPLFSIEAVIDIPAEQNVMDIRRELEALASQQNIDIEIRPQR